ncbi:MAG: hypothetical protein CVU44_10895 [Chloroflexi bacterium HGW-Chloroflexi-6]|nr:MAG: hypothetical protein CVU44_10895 [Chloroflexi bacterium HGW-Chloroflexi-6]
MSTSPTPEKTTPPPVDPAVERERRKMVATLSIGGVLLLVLIILSIVFLMMAEGETTSKIRDIFIIFMALESLVIGVALIVLIVQVSSLVNLLQNEVRPMLEATNETINTLRGTTEFLGENLVDPVIKLNSYLAGLRRLLDMVGIKQK